MNRKNPPLFGWKEISAISLKIWVKDDFTGARIATRRSLVSRLYGQWFASQLEFHTELRDLLTVRNSGFLRVKSRGRNMKLRDAMSACFKCLKIHCRMLRRKNETENAARPYCDICSQER